MLPSRPSPRTGGLPSGPRSRSIGRSRQDEYTSRYDQSNTPSTSSRQVRPQKSIASISNPRDRSRSRPPPLPESRQSQTRDRPEQPKTYRRSDESYSSVTSAGSSLLDRMRVGTGYASSRTSFEDDEPAYKTARRSEDRGRSLRDRRLEKLTPPRDETFDGEPNSATGEGHGYTIWSRVATAASTLTVSVSKAWATNIGTYAGEDTPPGQESRLLRAMKAYHLEKARDPTDLPSWLFEAHERRAAPRAREQSRRRRDEDEYEVIETPSAEPPKARGLRDIYASAAAKVPPPPKSEQSTPRRYGNDGAGAPSKATDRLKALRDAKRNANAGSSRFDDERSVRSSITSSRDVRTDDRREHRPSGESERRAPRVGLPSAPRARPGRT